MIKDLEKIRKMSDDELAGYLQYLENKKKDTCAKCYQDGANKSILIRKENDALGMQTKKLCKICDNCYEKMIDFLGVNPIDWD